MKPDHDNQLVQNLPDAYAYCRVIADAHGTPAECVILLVNKAFTKKTGLSREQIAGKCITKIIPGIEESGFDWSRTYEQAFSGSDAPIKQFCRMAGRCYEVNVYSSDTGYLNLLFRDITEIKNHVIAESIQAEAALLQNRSRLQGLFAEQEPTDAHARLLTVLDNIDAIIYIADIKTHEILFINRRAKDIFGDVVGKKCWEAIQGQQTGPCLFCTNDKLLDADGQPTGVHCWEFQNPHNGRWYACRDNALRWIDGRMVRLEIATDITERKQAEEALRKSEARIRSKLSSILSPRGELGSLDLADIIDVEAIQSMMNDFCSLTRIGIGILDLEGTVLVGAGWQDICTKFHRVHPETARHCLESDTILSQDVSSGTFKLYKCKNNMWDIATPLIIADRHVGNIFLGQFFFEDEAIDYDLFRSQAQKYGFNEKEYLEALERVPRFSRAAIDTAMDFYTRFANMISQLSYSNLELARLLSERDTMIRKLRNAEQKLADYNLELELLYQKLDAELDKAQQIHERVLPTELPRIKGLSLASHYQPAQKLGGDFYDVIHQDNKVFIYLSDVSGHGLDGAMLSIFVKHTIKSYLSFKPSGKLTPARILQHLREQFSRENYPEDYFVCLFLAILDLESLTLTYSSAGFHDHPLVFVGSGEKLVLAGEGVVISPNVPQAAVQYQENSIALTPGTTILFYTDGLAEEESGGFQYIERLPLVFFDHVHLQPEQIVRAVLDDFRNFNNGSLQGRDDITFLILQVEEQMSDRRQM